MNNPSFSSLKVLPYTYILTVSLTANASASANLTMESNSEFELHYLMASCSADADTDFMPNNFTAQLTDQSTGRVMSNGKVPQRCMFGPANSGLRQIRPVVFPPSAVIQADVTDTSGGVNVVTFSLIGYKLYP